MSYAINRSVDSIYQTPLAADLNVRPTKIAKKNCYRDPAKDLPIEIAQYIFSMSGFSPFSVNRAWRSIALGIPLFKEAIRSFFGEKKKFNQIPVLSLVRFTKLEKKEFINNINNYLGNKTYLNNPYLVSWLARVTILYAVFNLHYTEFESFLHDLCFPSSPPLEFIMTLTNFLSRSESHLSNLLEDNNKQIRYIKTLISVNVCKSIYVKGLLAISEKCNHKQIIKDLTQAIVQDPLQVERFLNELKASREENLYLLKKYFFFQSLFLSSNYPKSIRENVVKIAQNTSDDKKVEFIDSIIIYCVHNWLYLANNQIDLSFIHQTVLTLMLGAINPNIIAEGFKEPLSKGSSWGMYIVDFLIDKEEFWLFCNSLSKEKRITFFKGLIASLSKIQSEETKNKGFLQLTQQVPHKLDTEEAIEILKSIPLKNKTLLQFLIEKTLKM